MAKQNPVDNVRNSSLPLFISRRGVGELLRQNSFRGNDGEPVITEEQQKKAQRAAKSPKARLARAISTSDRHRTKHGLNVPTLSKPPWED